MSFEYPQYLLFLLLLLPLFQWLRAQGKRSLMALRLTLAVLGVLMLARPYISLQEEGLDLVVLADRSASIGMEGLDQETEFIQLLGKSRLRGAHDQISVISFAEEIRVESARQSGPVAVRFNDERKANGSQLAEALKSVRPSPYRQTRIAVLSDGMYTGADPLGLELLSNLKGREICCRQVGRTRVGDVAAASIVLPPSVERGAGFLVRFSLYSSAKREAQYVLYRGAKQIVSGNAMLHVGMNHFVARDIADVDGALLYELEVTADADPELGNNKCSGLVQVSAPPRVLVASTHGEAGVLATILRQASIPVDIVTPGAMDWSPAQLAPYKVVVLENIPLQMLGFDGTKALAEAVSSGVCGLLVSGGEASFGQGGYHKSAIDPLLPVTMELRQEQRRGLFALATVLDRSGSMSLPAGGGKTKMDLANLGTIEAIRMLSPMDQVAVFAVDSSPHTIVSLVQADDTEDLCRAVARIQSTGGGIFVKTGLDAAVAEIRKSKIPARHIILFSDAQDSEEQGGCCALAADLQKENIGISVVALGTPTDCDARFLRDLAAAGKGEIYFTDRPEELPRLFSQEVMRVSRRGFVKEPTASQVLPDMIRLHVPMQDGAPMITGYNLSSLRKDASCGMVTVDEYKSPLVAFWQRKRASTGTLMMELDGPNTGVLHEWKPMPALVVNMVRHIASGITQGSAATWTTNRYGEAEVRMEVEERVANVLRSRALHARFLPPAGGAVLDVPLVWESATEAVARVPLTFPGHYLPVIDLGEDGVVRAQPVTLSYSPEFMPRSGMSGEQVLRGLEVATGGRPIVKVDELFAPMEKELLSARRDISFWLALVFLLVLVFEIAEKRLAICELFAAWIPKQEDKSEQVER